MSFNKKFFTTGGIVASSSAVTCTTDSTDPFGDSSGVALYSLDYDASDAGGLYDGTPTDVTFGVGGQINYGARFNGSSSKITVSTSATTPVDFTSENFSISLWFKADSLHSGALIGKWSTSDGTGRAILLHTNSNGTFTFSERQGTSGFNLTTTSTYVADTWNHFVYVRNATQSILYLNKVSETDSRTNSINSGSNTELAIGYQTGGFKYFDGSIDQVRIFSKALSQTEVDTLYAETACVYTATTTDNDYPTTNLAYYKLDNSAEDEKGSYDGTESNIEYRFGRYGQAAVFNGSSSYISTGIGIDSYSSRSYSFWFQQNSSTGKSRVFGGVNGSATNGGMFRIKEDNGQINYYAIDNTAYTFTTTLPNDVWTHIALTDDGTTAKLYVNGSEITSPSTSSFTSTTNTNLQIGRGMLNTGSAGDYTNGLIDQVRIFSSALTSSQVTELYNEKPETDTSNFKAVLYEGTGASQYISNVGMDLETNGGLVWLKGRDSARNNRIFDSVRGATKRIYSDVANAEATESGLDSFEKSGFFLGSVAGMNANNESFVSWVFKGGGEAVAGTGTGVSNVSVSANTDAGFSIVKYTGGLTSATTSTGASVQHGLGAPPDLIISKALTGTHIWSVRSTALDDMADTLWLHDARNVITSYRTSYPIASSTNDVMYLNYLNSVNVNNQEVIAYCFRSISGYSKIGSYSGDGNPNHEITDVGFQPNFLLIKNTQRSGTDWLMYDNRRGTTPLASNQNFAESTYGTSYEIEFISNGFKIIDSTNATNESGTDNFIYMAFK
jgi:hypothetical protein